jgi:hypothetical protein
MFRISTFSYFVGIAVIEDLLGHVNRDHFVEDAGVFSFPFVPPFK